MNVRVAGLALAALLTAAAFAQEPAQRPPEQQPTQQTQGSLRERAAEAENRGAFSEAADLYLELSKAEPSRAQWALAAGRCLGSSGRFREAIDFLESKRATFAPLPDVPALLARTYLLRVERDPGAVMPEVDYHEAASIAEEVLRGNPDHLDTRLILAQARYALSDLAGARQAAEEAAKRHPEHPGSHVLIGRIAYDEYLFAKAAFDKEEQDSTVREQLVSTIDAARKRAQAAFAKAASLDPSRTFPHVVLGDIAARDRDVKAALQHWGDALSVDPDARVDHGWMRSRLKPEERQAFYDAARTSYETRTEHDKAKAATLRFYSGLARYEAGSWKDAKTEFEAAKAQNPDYTNVGYYVAMCCWRLEDQDGAEQAAATLARESAKAFADILRTLTPEERADVAAIIRYLGDRAWKESRRDQSRDLNHVIACLQDSADAWNNYAFLCRETKQFDEAYLGYQHALEREPDSPQLWNDAAVVLHYHLGGEANLRRAKAMYERALELAKTQSVDASATQLVRDRAARAKQDAEANLAALAK